MSFERIVAHLDMDAFYASVELRRQPELRGKPVVVCGSGPRAVVTTASYEARKLAGIHSAMPAAVARRRLPDAVYIQPDFVAYREASGQVMAILRANAETVEVVGLDEAYVDLTGIFSPKATMRRIAAEIHEETGLTCSIGISESRHARQDHQRAGQARRARRPLARGSPETLRRRIPGPDPRDRPEVGRQARGDGNPHARRPACPATPRRSSGPSARARAAGCTPAADLIDDTPVVVEHETKSQSAETTFDTDVAERAAMESTLAARRGALPPPAQARPCRPHDRDQGPPRRLDQRHPLAHVEPPTNDPAVVGPVALDLLRAYDPPRPVRLLGVRVAGFAGEDNERSQPSQRSDPQLRLGIAA